MCKLTLSEKMLLTDLTPREIEQLKELTLKPQNEGESSVMQMELSPDHLHGIGMVVLGRDDAGTIRGWGLINKHDLLQVFVHDEYRHMKNGQAIVTKLVEGLDRELYALFQNTNLTFWNKIVDNVYPNLILGYETIPGGIWEFRKNEPSFYKNNFPKLILYADKITPDTNIKDNLQPRTSDD